MSDNTNLVETLSDNPNFIPATSTNEIYFDTDMNVCLTDMLLENYAASNHTHDGYASQDDLDLLEDVVATKAATDHVHSGYANVSHTHTDYVTTTSFDALNESINTHTHSYNDLKDKPFYDGVDYFSMFEDGALTVNFYDWGGTYGAVITDMPNAFVENQTYKVIWDGVEYLLICEYHGDNDTGNPIMSIGAPYGDYSTYPFGIDSIMMESGTYEFDVYTGSTNVSHVVDIQEYEERIVTIDEKYIPETIARTVYIDDALVNKANVSHNHDEAYDVKGSANTALDSAKSYTDSKIDAIVGDGASTTLDTIGEISSAIEENQDTIDLLNSAIGSKANVSHAHTISDVADLQVALDNKATISHTHDYVPTARTVNGKALNANITLTASDVGALSVNTEIPDALSDLNDDSTHRLVTDAEKAMWNDKSNFSGNYNDLTNKPNIPSVDGLATEIYVDEAVSEKSDVAHTHVISSVTGLQSALDSKAANDHNHNSVYYTETEVNSLLANKSDTTHNHNSVYDALGTAEEKANEALNSAEEYADEIVASEATARDTAIATAKTSAVSTAASDATTKVNNHNTSTSAHSDIRTLIANLTTKLNNFLDVDDTTTDQLSEVITLINNNKGTLESLTIGKVNVSDIIDNLTTSNASKVLSAKQGVAIKNLIDALQSELDSHTHAIADVSGLQNALNEKAASSHGTHVTYSTTTPVMDGAASVGTAATVARSDHKHPTDTSRASQTDLDALETVVAGKADSSHTHTISNVTNLQTSLDAKQATITGGASTIASSNLTANRALISNGSGKVAVSAVTSTELGYLDGVTSTIQTQLDGKAASSHTHNYAGSSSAGGAATSANKLNTNAGSATQPVYFANGVPVACSTSFGDYMTKANPIGTGTLSINRESGTTVGDYSVALGINCESSAYASHAEGDCTTASGLDAHSEGRGTTASGYHSHAQGIGTTASGTGSHAEGTGTTASGMYCHAEGASTTAKGYQTHAEGTGTIAAGSDQHVHGRYNIESPYQYITVIGNGTNNSGTITRSNAHTLDWSGNAWYAGDVYVGGTSQSDGTKLVSLTTTKATITSFSSGWAVYGSTSTPTVRKFGNTVSLTGALKNSSAVTLNTSQVQVFTIPSGYRPTQDLVVVCQGSGANRYVLHITTDGAVSIGRYGTTSFSEVASGSWFPFHVSWVIE